MDVYPKDEINEILKCSKCKERLDEPTMLPCGQTVCSPCLNSIYVNNKKFKCIICNNEHPMPENGLPINKVVQALLSMQPKEVYRGQAVETLKETLNAMRNKRNLLQTTSNNGIDKIKEKCIELRNQVQVATEQAIKQINDLSDSFIKEIDQYEKETIKSYQSNKVDREEIIKTINDLDTFFSKWTEYLKQTKINEEIVLKTNTQAVQFNEKADKELSCLDYFIFSKGLMTFTRNTNNKLEKSLLGSLDKECLNIFLL